VEQDLLDHLRLAPVKLHSDPAEAFGKPVLDLFHPKVVIEGHRASRRPQRTRGRTRPPSAEPRHGRLPLRFDLTSCVLARRSDDPMPPDYPWNGTVSLPGQVARGGETEDYPVFIEEHVGVGRSTWGTFKHLYR
jgi:hypothetical protein